LASGRKKGESGGAGERARGDEEQEEKQMEVYMRGDMGFTYPEGARGDGGDMDAWSETSGAEQEAPVLLSKLMLTWDMEEAGLIVFCMLHAHLVNQPNSCEPHPYAEI
jgi:hypothetical protein